MVLKWLVWYPILDRFRTEYYGVIVNSAKEIEIAKVTFGETPIVS